MTKKVEPDRDARLRNWLRECANNARDTADEISLQMDGCDDPLHPGATGVFGDWRDFVDRVARPLIEAEDAPDPDVAEQAAMKLYRTANPYFICAAMVMMDNRLKQWERDGTDA